MSSELRRRYPEMSDLGSLLAGISLPTSNPSSDCTPSPQPTPSSDPTPTDPTQNPFKIIGSAHAADARAGEENISRRKVVVPPVVPPRPCSPWTMSQLAPLVQQLRPEGVGGSEGGGVMQGGVLDALRNLDEVSKRRVEVLYHFLVRLGFFFRFCSRCQ